MADNLTSRVLRQHSETEVRECYGAQCDAFLAVCSMDSRSVGPMYIRLNGKWHRFYLDAGLLFWEEGTEPDEENDLLDNERYVSWGELLSVTGVALEEAKMHDSTLALGFKNGARVVLRHGPRDEATAIVEVLGPA